MICCEDMKELIDKYKLSERKHNEIYKVIKEMVFNNVTPTENPIAIIVGAQPGSGKGSLIGYSKKEFQDNNVVIITTDDYKPFHPNASEIAHKYPTMYSPIVEEDSAKWTSKILQEAIINKYSFIFEVTFKNERILERMRELKENGFKVIVRGLAVSYLESLLSAYERYEKQLETRNWGRFFDPLNYNKIYQSIPNTIEKIENSEYWDILEIYKRGEDIKFPELIYGIYKDCSNNCISKYNTAKEAIIRYRNEELEVIRNDAKERVEKLENDFQRRIATSEEKDGLNVLKEIVNNY